MAVSLVSTGVQFPDSTIQTTAAGASGLTLISTTTASGSPSQVNITSGFSSTYNDYLIIFENVRLTGVSSSGGLMRIYIGGSVKTSSDYAFQQVVAQSAVGINRVAGIDSVYSFVDIFDTVGIGSGQLLLTNTNATDNLYTGNYQFFATNPSASGGNNFSLGSFGNSISGPITGIRFYWASGSATFLSGTFKLYGLAK